MYIIFRVIFVITWGCFESDWNDCFQILWNVLPFLCKIKYVNKRDCNVIMLFLMNIYIDMLTCMLQVNKDKSHVNVNKLHVKKIMLHVDLIHLVTKKNQKYTTISKCIWWYRLFLCYSWRDCGRSGRGRPKSRKQIVTT